jgi:pimeloyl-ACP methyl ester carboxylesterase
MEPGTHHRAGHATIAGSVAALATASLFMFSPNAAGEPDDPASSAAADDLNAPIVWHVCDPPGPPGVTLQCARIAVPLDWNDPHGRKISLALIRLLGSKPKERIGTLFINPGGPADTGIGLVQGDPKGLDAIGEGRFDVVSWDPRGTNASTRVLCFRDSAEEQRFWAGVTFPLTVSQERLQLAADLAKRCGEVSGWLLPHISTADTARDLDHLRVLFGEEKINYVGLSYGTFLGQTYANLFPNRIRAMLLNGLIDAIAYSKSTEAREDMFAGPTDDVFNRFLTTCDSAGAERCALAGGGESAAARVGPLFAHLKGGPTLPAPGATPPLLSPQTLDYIGLLLSQFPTMRAPSVWPRNAADFAAALGGDGSGLASAGGNLFFTPAGMASALASAAIQCADAPNDKGPQAAQQVLEHFEQVSRLQGVFHLWWEWAPCAFWPVRGQDNYRGPWDAKTPVKILLINQRHDPNTGYANAVHASKYLANAVLLTHEGYGHLWFQDPSVCVSKAMADYLINLTTPPEGTRCRSDHAPFDPHFGEPPQLVDQELP